MRILFLDIETVPTERSLQDNGLLGTEIKPEQAELIKKLSLSATTARLLCLGYAIDPPADAPAEILQGNERTILEKFGRIDILVNNAAIFATIPMNGGGIDSIDPAEWDRMMAVNLKGLFYCCRAILPVMRQQKSGKIVNISSGTVLNGSAGRIHYVTSKAGVIGFTRCLAREVGDDNINVNAIAPGSTLSEDNPSEEVLKMRGARVTDRALKRVQLPKDLVGTVLFLCSPLSDFMTGQTVAVDGGACFL